MHRTLGNPISIAPAHARRIWLRAQRLDTRAPFGNGPAATHAAVEHLGYVQIDTIHVIERCHHHILFARIPGYRREHLHRAQSIDKSVFECWTHALSYVPTRDLPFFLGEMARFRRKPLPWLDSVRRGDIRRVLRLIRATGPLTIRDFADEVLVEKEHLWASRKPSKWALQFAFHAGDLTISKRSGMLKTYELIDRHFGWSSRPRRASERQVDEYALDRALRAQGLVSVDSVCYGIKRKPAIRRLIESRARAGKLVPVRIKGADAIEHWAEPATLDAADAPANGQLVHILSPFDPLIIQRKRLRLFFGYDHVFEAYVPKAKRRFGYFALPVLVGDEVAAAIDLKTDRERRKLLTQQWTWIGRGPRRALKAQIEDELHRFERFQLGD